MFESEVKVTVTEKDAPYAPKEQLGDYVLRRWTWKEKQQASFKSTTVTDAKKNLYETDIVEYEMMELLTCLKSSPFVKSYDMIAALDPAVGDIVMAACRKLNGLTTTEQANLSTPSEPAKDTSISPSTGSVPI